jgi:hypothetical protein
MDPAPLRCPRITRPILRRGKRARTSAACGMGRGRGRRNRAKIHSQINAASLTLGKEHGKRGGAAQHSDSRKRREKALTWRRAKREVLTLPLAVWKGRARPRRRPLVLAFLGFWLCSFFEKTLDPKTRNPKAWKWAPSRSPM